MASKPRNKRTRNPQLTIEMTTQERYNRARADYSNEVFTNAEKAAKWWGISPATYWNYDADRKKKEMQASHPGQIIEPLPYGHGVTASEIMKEFKIPDGIPKEQKIKVLESVLSKLQSQIVAAKAELYDLSLGVKS